MKSKSKWLIFIGLFLIVSALFLAAYNLREDTQAKKSAAEAAVHLKDMLPMADKAEEPMQQEQILLSTEVEIPDYILNPDMEMPVKTVDGQDYIGLLTIPDLGMELPVISKWSYPRLKIAPCRYQGSAYKNDLIIAAHNYNSHFSRLKSLYIGAAVTFTDMDGNVFNYEVVELDTLGSTDIEEMANGDWDLTLFTCTPGSRSRTTVRCELVEK
ncbi:MAG: sortase [Lachnospiraceae bacterium]|jgi:sortase A